MTRCAHRSISFQTALPAALALLLSAASLPAAAAVRIQVAAGAVSVWDGDRQLSAGGPSPLVSILYSTRSDIWKAQQWEELKPDSQIFRSTPDGLRLKISSFEGRKVRVDLEGRVDSRKGLVRWRLRLTNQSPGVVVGVVGPLLQGVEDRSGGVLYYPDRPGQALPDPWSHLQAAVFQMVYPVPASMQYLAYSNPHGGVAFHVLDRQMVYKELLFGGPDRELGVIQYPFTPQGGRWISPPVVWQTLRGDWHQAADFYRAWFRSWASRPQVSPEVKQFPVMGGIVIRARPVDDANLHDVMKKQEVGTYAAALQKALELKTAGFQGAHLVGWFGQGHDTTYPDFEPSDSMGGEAGLLRLVDGMHQAGLLVTFYLNARLGNVNGATLLAHPDWRARLPNGQQWLETYGNQTFTCLCPDAAGFRAHLEEALLRVAGQYHGDGVQLDQVGAASAVLCFDRTHGHRTPATAWAEGYMKMLRGYRDRARKVNPGFWDWIEGAWEGAGQYVDLSQGGFWPAVPGCVYFPQMYHYTLPEHLLFGDASMGGIPYWCPSDIHRAMRIDSAVGPVFLNGRFMDDVGLTVSPPGEAHWFLQGDRAVLTVRNSGAAPVTFDLALQTAAAGRTNPPQRSTALAAGTAAPTRLDAGAFHTSVAVPPGQVEAVLLEWPPVRE